MFCFQTIKTAKHWKNERIQTKHHHPWTKQSDFTPKTPCFMVFLIDFLRLFRSPPGFFSTSTSLRTRSSWPRSGAFPSGASRWGISWPRGSGWGLLIGGRGRKGGFKMLKWEIYIWNTIMKAWKMIFLFHWMIFGFHHVPSVNFSWISILAGFVACRC